MPSKMQLFHVNSAPRLARMPPSAIDSGMPPSRIPAGQIYLQKNGSPKPTSFTIVMGRTITKTTRMTYLRQVRKCSFLVLHFLWGSCEAIPETIQRDTKNRIQRAPAVPRSKSGILQCNRQTEILKNRSQPARNRLDRKLPLRDKSSSSGRGHRGFLSFPYGFFPEKNSEETDWKRGLPPVELSICVDSYPMPTHSKHRLIPLLKTVAASPRNTPIPIITIESMKRHTVDFLSIIP